MFFLNHHRVLTITVLVCLCASHAPVFGKQAGVGDTTVTTTAQQAAAYLDGIDSLAQSPHWPNINPAAFLQNLRQNIKQPLHIYEGVSTNFCSYAALTYLVLHTNPLGYAQLMVTLYKTGKGKLRGVAFSPSREVMHAAGSLRFKGALDVHPADQLWFLCLANHFKGYLNFFSNRYKDGDEDKLWAATNFAKFNRMTRQLLNLKVEAAGSDLIRPWISDLYGYLSQRVGSGTVVMYLNNTYLFKKNHATLKLGVPTHYVVLEKISQDSSGLITMVYWDYGARTLRQVTPAFLKRIVFGISHSTLKKEDGQK